MATNQYNFVPGRGTYTAVKTYTNIDYFSLVNTGEGNIYVKNEAGDVNSASTTIPPGGTYNTLTWAGNTWQKYAKLVIDASASIASVEFYALES